MTRIAELIEEEVSKKVDTIDTDFNINSELSCHSIREYRANYHGGIKTLADIISKCVAGCKSNKSVDE